MTLPLINMECEGRFMSLRSTHYFLYEKFMMAVVQGKAGSWLPAREFPCPLARCPTHNIKHTII